MMRKLILTAALLCANVAHAQVPVQVTGNYQVIEALGPQVEACSALMGDYIKQQFPGVIINQATIHGTARVVGGKTEQVAIVTVQYSNGWWKGNGECWAGLGQVLAAEVFFPSGRKTWLNGVWH